MDHSQPEQPAERLHVDVDVVYNWQHDGTHRQLMRLYENAKRDQWNATSRLDWSIEVDPRSELVPDMALSIFGTEMWDRLTQPERERLRYESMSWQLCQFLHGEQGTLLAIAQIVDAVP